MLAALVASALAPFVSPAPAQAASVTHVYLHFNMCGNKCNSAGLGVANAVISSINNRNPQPLVVTLNEVCRSQYNHMYGSLAPYYGRFETTVPARCADGSDYGIAILLKTSVYSFAGAWWLPEADKPSVEDRKVMCLRTTATGGGTQPLVACVTHIDPDSAVSDNQIQAVSDYVEPLWSGNHVMVGGDFNVTPKSSRINPMYSNQYSPAGNGIFNEADRPTTWSRNTDGCACATNEYTTDSVLTPQKIDYIFLSRYDFENYTADATTSSYSDHQPLWATVTYV
ncbi:endonuclease/exonuclease/phosphatase family protein [Catellatospora sp. NPDC049609]|uniref:endonuclease/exonuclease/phosphatase family protein n=1 Tax=Catellatospora sp. NPDC049609 TaxID=3155505 RepID=UPI0034349073